MFKYELAEFFNLEFGPQIGFLISAELEDYDVSEDFETIDFGGNLGLSYDISEQFILGTRYNFGLTNVADDDDFDVKNGVFTFSVGYRF
ncbi:MAG TPA: outer membrane beta-barrel protein, partial [Flavobacteriaceae bacterium]|nr:outer membrane beta-barrel protein [Flavobacteriaceae bacterium]